jgi:hypothetical protein
MIYVYVVISIWHTNKKDYTFVHGVFEDMNAAEEVMHDVSSDYSFVEKEGYTLQDHEGISTYISIIPYAKRVNDFVPINN